MSAPSFVDRKTFVVPVTAGNYAPEVITFAASANGSVSPGLLGVTVLVEAAVAAAVIELWLLKVGGDPTLNGSYFLHQTLANGQTVALASYPGAQIRVKSGGTAGNCTINASAD